MAEYRCVYCCGSKIYTVFVTNAHCFAAKTTCILRKSFPENFGGVREQTKRLQTNTLICYCLMYGFRGRIIGFPIIVFKI